MNPRPRTYVYAVGPFALSLFTWVVSAEPPDPKSAPPGHFTLPATPAGRCAAAYLDAFNSGDDERMREFTRQYREESYLQKNPIESIIKKYRTIYGTSGILTPHRILQSRDCEIILRVRLAQVPGFADVRFEVAKEPPHKLAVFTIDFVGSSESDTDSRPVDVSLIRSTIQSAAEILRKSYVDPDKGKDMAEMLVRNDAAGRYARITNGPALAAKITEDLQALSGDKHLAVREGSPPHESSTTPARLKQPRPGAKEQIDWPDTPAGRQGKAYFEVYNGGHDDDLRRFIKEHFSEAAFKEQPFEELFAFHSGMRAMAGRVTFHSVRTDGDFTVHVSLNAEKTGWARLGIEVAPEPPHGIISFDDLTPSAEDTRNNYGFRRVEVLPGNIGYIRFDQFHESEEARETAAAALAFVANCDALIFDLRYNGGGTRHLTQFISSYLFGKATHLGGQYSRLTDSTTEWQTFEEIPGKRFSPEIPVYILTSSITFSAAEAFTYWLKDLKRATIVGETTGGGAHPVHERVINERFWIRVPFARAVSPVTKTDWEGVGVIPDIKVSASEALDAACEDADRRIHPR